MKCDYSAVNMAKSDRYEIFTNCMISKGWQLESKPAPGGDSSGGVFEYVAYDNNNEFFIKEGTVERNDNVYTAVVRQSSKDGKSISYQGFYVFDTYQNTLTVDNESPVYINKGSAAEFILRRLKRIQ